MWFLTRMAIVFYVTILWIASISVVLFAFHALDLETVNQIISVIYYDRHVGWIVAGVAGAVIAISLLLENLIYGQRRMKRTIAFDNPSGPVTVSLSALEDLIKRLTDEIPQIKEIRPYMVATKKGLHVETKLVLRAQANIPELTSRLQELIRRRIEEVIGLEGKINVKVHVTKINLDEVKVGSKRTVDVSSGHVPFHGYRS